MAKPEDPRPVASTAVQTSIATAERPEVVASTMARPSGVVAARVGRASVTLTHTRDGITVTASDGRVVELPFARVARVRVGLGAPVWWVAFLGVRLRWEFALRIWTRDSRRELRFFPDRKAKDVAALPNYMRELARTVLEDRADIRLEVGASWFHTTASSVFPLCIGLMFTVFGVGMLLGPTEYKGEGLFGFVIAGLAAFLLRGLIRQIPRRVTSMAEVERALGFA